MSFKFSFKPDSDDEHESNGMQLDNHDAGVGQSNGEEKSERTGVVAAVEVVADQEPNTVPVLAEPMTFPSPSPTSQAFTLLKRDLSDAKFQIALSDDLSNTNSVLVKAVVERTDLIAGSYEGGLKTWECAVDLVRYLSGKWDPWQGTMEGMKVLELGCGSALPGLYCLVNGASKVHLQDYNEQVIRLVTMPNVVLNTLSENPTAEALEDEMELDLSLAKAGGRVRYFAGDWSGLPSLLDSEKYDLVLTSETIYSREAHTVLLDAIEATLAPTGVCLVAAKRNYFGLSGTLFDFIKTVEGRGRMEATKVVEVEGGVNREIWELKWRG